MAETRQWRELRSDEEFTALFTNATIVRATTYETGLPYVDADLFWLLSDGRWLAMHVSTGGGCDTCGYGAGEKTYWLLDGKVAT